MQKMNGVLWRFIDTKKVKQLQREALEDWCRSWNSTPTTVRLVGQKPCGLTSHLCELIHWLLWLKA
jgi:hypothetical protein